MVQGSGEVSMVIVRIALVRYLYVIRGPGIGSPVMSI